VPNGSGRDATGISVEFWVSPVGILLLAFLALCALKLLRPVNHRAKHALIRRHVRGLDDRLPFPRLSREERRKFLRAPRRRRRQRRQRVGAERGRAPAGGAARGQAAQPYRAKCRTDRGGPTAARTARPGVDRGRGSPRRQCSQGRRLKVREARGKTVGLASVSLVARLDRIGAD
jgi:hypothetical protein